MTHLTARSQPLGLGHHFTSWFSSMKLRRSMRSYLVWVACGTCANATRWTDNAPPLLFLQGQGDDTHACVTTPLPTRLRDMAHTSVQQQEGGFAHVYCPTQPHDLTLVIGSSETLSFPTVPCKPPCTYHNNQGRTSSASWDHASSSACTWQLGASGHMVDSTHALPMVATAEVKWLRQQLSQK